MSNMALKRFPAEMSVRPAVPLIFGLLIVAAAAVIGSGVNTASLSLEKCSEGSALIFGTNHIDIDKNNPHVTWDSNGGCRVTFHGSVRCEEEILLQRTDPDGSIHNVFLNWTACGVRTTTGPTSTTPTPPSAFPPNVTLTAPPGGSSRHLYGLISSIIFIIFFVAIIIIIIISRILNRSRKTKEQSCSNGTVSNPDIEHGGVGITLLNGNGVHKNPIT